MEAEVGRERDAASRMELRHLKDIENLKLMHAQELYILRKKDKKN